MEIRGQRECKDCGQEWSYYDTGSVACPNCESLRSVGIGDRQRHTDAPASLDLTAILSSLEEADIGAIADEVTDSLRAYTRKRGFINAGELQPLDEEFLIAHELTQALDIYGRLRDPHEQVEYYVLALLRGASDGERPEPDAVPPAMREARGLGYAEAVSAYRRDLLEWLDDHPDSEARRTLGTLHEQLKRLKALQGDVDPEAAEGLVVAARKVGSYLETGNEEPLSSARDRLARLSV